MDRERSKRIEEIYRAALEQEPQHRDSFLVRVCGGDVDLRREVAALLAPSEATLTLGAAADCDTGAEQPEARTDLKTGERLGPYEVVGRLGAGGMGTVYRGLDTRLGRAVAIKISAEQFSRRFEREARAISALNHPHICTLYDVGSLSSGDTYMITELVEGETLRDWLRHSPETERKLDVARQVLQALRAAHAAGIVHRDLKPANIMVRFDGYVKVLDFGLAKSVAAAGNSGDTGSIPGRIMGTIPYMSPEQILGQEVDPRSDLFTFGIILYEMLAGQHPWPCHTTFETLQAILHDPAPPASSPCAGIIEKLLRKNPAERYASAEAVLDGLANPAAEARASAAPTRLIVLPFRILRHDETTDFLSVSLPDAITNSLAAIDSLVVRSTLGASRLAASGDLDVQTIAAEAHVDAILTGTILSDGERLRVSTQLIQAPDGRLLWSNTSQASLRDIFQLQDELVQRIVQSLALPLTAREQRALRHDVPANAAGYEFYLRGNQLVAAGYNAQNMILARDLYLQSVDADPHYAPAWASLARAHRYVGKFVEDEAANHVRAEAAFQKAFQLNPDLALTHNFYTAHECDSGRSLQAMERLIKRAHTHRNDPNLLTGLVQAFRYCGQLEASLAAHDQAVRLDPHIRTSVAYTYLQLGEFQKALELCPTPTDFYVVAPALEALGRLQEAIGLAREFERNGPEPLRPSFAMWVPLLEGDPRTAVERFDRLPKLLTDPEARFFTGCHLAKMNQPDRAFEFLTFALEKGYRGHRALLHDPWLESLRSDARFRELVNRSAEMSFAARTVFVDTGGDRIFGSSAA